MKPKILFILHLPPPVHGASIMGNYVKTNNKINEIFDCTYLNLSASKSINSIEKISAKKIFFFFHLLFSVASSLIKKKYDVCYVTIASNGIAFYKDFFIITILKIFRKKILLHFHNKGVKKGTKSNKLNRHLYKFILGGKRTRIILLSPRLYDDIKEYADQKNVYYCANGIHCFNGITIPSKKISETVRLLFLSNMMIDKGVLVLLEACVQLKERNIRFECHFVGDWLNITETTFHQHVKMLNLSNNVFAHGKKYGDEKNVFYQHSDIFVFPSFYEKETFGLVLLEAMQFELPVVACDEGGIPDVVLDNETGYIVAKNNPAELADKLALLIKDPLLRQKMGLAGKKRYEENFTLNKFEERMASIINDFADAT